MSNDGLHTVVIFTGLACRRTVTRLLAIKLGLIDIGDVYTQGDPFAHIVPGPSSIV